MPPKEVVVMVVNNVFMRIPTSIEGKEQDTRNIVSWPTRECEQITFIFVPTY
jgi:hypothetical protein